MQVPPALAEAAIIGPTSEIIRRVEIYEADGLTRWMSGANDDRLLGGSVTIDYSRDERRSMDLELDNSDFGLEHTPTAFWYDKVMKVFCGVRYTAPSGTTTQQTRTNYFWNPHFEATSAAYAMRKNWHINPLFVDGNLDGTPDGLALYTTNGATGTPTCPSGKWQAASVNLPAGVSRYGISTQPGTWTASATQLRTVSVEYTLTGAAANKRVALYVDPQDASNAIVAGTTVVAYGTSTAGKLVVNIPANIAIVKANVYMWVDTTDNLAASGITATFTRPLIEESSVAMPYFDVNNKARERYNYHINSLCTYGNTTGWYTNNGTLYSGVLDTTRGTPFGQNSMKWTRTATTPSTIQTSFYSHNGVSLIGWKCLPGDWISASIWVSTDAANRSGSAYMYFYNAASSTVGNTQGTLTAMTVGGWTKLTVIAQAPAGTDAFVPMCNLVSNNAVNVPTNEDSWATAWMVEKTRYPTPRFFHPSLQADNGFTAAWEGTANQSAVLLYFTDPTYAWTGTANASPTEMRGTNPNYVTTLSNSCKTFRSAGGNGSNGAYTSRSYVVGAAQPNSGLFQYHLSSLPTSAPGDIWSMRTRARVVLSQDRDLTVSVRFAAYGGSGYIDSMTGFGNTVLPKDGTWVDIILPNVQAAPTGTTTVRYLAYNIGQWEEGECVELDTILYEKVAIPGGWFDGAIPDFGNRDFQWSGGVNASNSLEVRTIIDQTPVETEWEVQVGEFMIDSITEDHFPYTVKVNGRDYTKKCLTSKFTTATSFANGSAIENVIKTIATNAGISKFIMPLTGKTLGKDYVFERGTSRWEAMKQIADGFGYELFFDAQGYLVMREYLDPVTAPLAYTLETGLFGNLVSYTKTVNDTRIYNHIVVTGESQDSNTIPVSAEAKNLEPSSPTRIAKIGDRVYQYSSSFITTTLQAQDVADKFLQLHALEEFDLNFSSIALPWLEVGEIVEFEDPRPSAGQPTRFLLSSLTLPLDLGAMSGNAKRVSVVG